MNIRLPPHEDPAEFFSHLIDLLSSTAPPIAVGLLVSLAGQILQDCVHPNLKEAILKVSIHTLKECALPTVGPLQ